jgi:hypothetical protein
MKEPPDNGQRVDGAYGGRMDVDPIRKATAATLRQVAGWGWVSDGQQRELYALADQVETESEEASEMICAVCEETECDEGCPLEPVRSRA